MQSTVDKNLIGQKIEINNKKNHPGIYIDNYLRKLTENYPISHFNIDDCEKKVRSDLGVSNKFSGAYDKIERLIVDAQKQGFWSGIAYEEHMNWLKKAEDCVLDAKETEFPRSGIGFRRGLYDLLNEGYVYSPNIESPSSDFTNRIIIIPTERLIQYFVSLNE